MAMYRLFRFANRLLSSKSHFKLDVARASAFTSVWASVGTLTLSSVFLANIPLPISCSEDEARSGEGDLQVSKSNVAEVEAAFQEYLERAGCILGAHVKAFSAALAHRDQPLLEILTTGTSDEIFCGLAALHLLHFADFSVPILRNCGMDDDSQMSNVVKSLAIAMHGRFVRAADACGGVPRHWASACRNVIANVYAFPLLADSDMSAIAVELLARGVSQVIDPLAGTGLHARMLHEAGFRVIAQDARPMSSVGNGLGWHAVQTCFLEDARWSDWTGNDFVLWLSWPPRLSSASETALKNFGGRYVVFIGDRGCWTGSDSFHALLRDDWKEIWRLRILQWPHMQDDVRLYERRVS